VERGEQRRSPALGRLDHGQRVGRLDRQRLLAAHGDATLQGLDRDRGVQVVGQGDDHRVDQLGLQQGLVVGERRHPALGERAQLRLVEVARGDEGELGVGVGGAHEERRDRADP